MNCRNFRDRLRNMNLLGQFSQQNPISVAMPIWLVESFLSLLLKFQEIEENDYKTRMIWSRLVE